MAQQQERSVEQLSSDVSSFNCNKLIYKILTEHNLLIKDSYEPTRE